VIEIQAVAALRDIFKQVYYYRTVDCRRTRSVDLRERVKQRYCTVESQKEEQSGSEEIVSGENLLGLMITSVFLNWYFLIK
jgi:hypothetical protein